MKVVNLAQIMADVYEQHLRETPDPFRHDNIFAMKFSDMFPPKTYREILDEQPRNYYGQLIPRIVTVRRNLRRLKAGY